MSFGRTIASSLLVALGGALSACPSQPDDPFDRDGFVDPVGDDDDDGTGGPGLVGDPEAGDRIAFWDVVQRSDFSGGAVSYETRAWFFPPQVLPIPQPAPEECFANGTDTDPWEPMATSVDFGTPSIRLDDEDWELSTSGSEWWQRGLPARTWESSGNASLALSGGAEIEQPVQYDDALSLPVSLVGTDISLDGETGLSVSWVPDLPDNQLLLVLKGDDSGRTEYVVCAPRDDGEFVVPPALFEDYPPGEVEVLLRRERTNDMWVLATGGWGRTVGVSEVRAEFTISESTFGGGDDDDSAP